MVTTPSISVPSLCSSSRQVNSSQAVLRCEYPGTVVQRLKNVRDEAGEGVSREMVSSLSSEEREETASDKGVEEAQS